eukprot:m.548036 g.548036  ORF g.548036 m.548036 type:complete len:68 (-) comp22158_c1_seq26:33-236(-)
MSAHRRKPLNPSWDMHHATDIVFKQLAMRHLAHASFFNFFAVVEGAHANQKNQREFIPTAAKEVSLN